MLAVDGAGRPALTLNTPGRGKAFFSVRSLEWALAGGSSPRPPVHLLYRALRAEAGIAPPCDSSHPELNLNLLESADGERLLLVINHSDSPVEGKVHIRFPLARVRDLESGAEVEVREGMLELHLEPWEVKALKLGGG